VIVMILARVERAQVEHGALPCAAWKKRVTALTRKLAIRTSAA